MSFSVIILIILGVVIAVGWIPIGIGGIVALKKQKRGAGLAMAIIASVWCIVAFFVLFVGAIGWLVYSEVLENTAQPKTFDASSYKGKTGTLKLDGWDKMASFSTNGSRSKRLVFNTDNGTFIVPVGEQQISYLSLSSNDENNKYWSASISPASWTKPFKFNIEENKTASFTTGGPFKVEISAKQKNGKHTFTMSMQDKAGHKAMIYGSGKDKPAVLLLDDKGNTIWEKTLEYG